MIHFCASIVVMTLLSAAPAWGQQSAPVTHSDVQAEPRAVAILPAYVPSDEPAHNGIANFMSAELGRQLATINGIRLVPTQVTQLFANSSQSPFDIAETIGARTLIRVNVRPGLQGIIISISVRDTAARSLGIWSSGYSRVDDIPAPINRVQHAVAAVRETVEFWADADLQQYRAAMREAVEPIFLDQAQTDQARMHALSVLAPPRFGVGDELEYPDQGASLGGAIAFAAARIAMASDDADVRREVWETMAGVRDPELARPLLVALQEDEDAGVRTAAARALETHLAEPGVAEALQHVRSTDADIGVREAARAVLASPRRAFNEQRSAFMDAATAPADRWKGLTALMLIQESNPVPIDGALLDSIAEFAGVAPDPWKRVSAWQRYTSLAGYEAIAPLTKALEFDDNEIVRERLVMELSRFADNPAVASSIDRACSNDDSMEVRYAAYRALEGSCSGRAAAYKWNWPESGTQPE